MIIVKFRDKRCHHGERIEFTKYDEVTAELYEYVKERSNAYLVLTRTDVYTRDEFLDKFNHVVQSI